MNSTPALLEAPKPTHSGKMIDSVENPRQAAIRGSPLATTLSPPVASREATTLIFNPQDAMTHCCNSEVILRKVILGYFDEVADLFPQMRAALEEGDLVEVGRLGHRIKGTVIYLGAEPAKEAALRVERFCKPSGRTATEAEEAVNTLKRECLELRAALSEYLRGADS